MSLSLITPNWDAPTSLVAFTTTVDGGVSEPPYASLNLGTHVGDDSHRVMDNRQRLQAVVGPSVQLCWLHQTHSDILVDVSDYQGTVEADAAVTAEKHKACVVMTADCLPILLANQQGSRVAALHCGWKGLAQQLIAKTITQYFAGDSVRAWLGPAIAPASYEVDTALYQRFIAIDASYQSAFQSQRPGHYLMDLYAIATQQLSDSGVAVQHIYGGEYDTYTDRRFFSYRRNATTGRIATVIYLR